MAFEDLQILHIRLKGDKSVSGTIHALLSCLEKPFIAETCARQIFMFEHADDSLQPLIDKSQAEFKTCEVIRGEKAYLFALQWLAGYKSKKYHNNDRFVLGKARKAFSDSGAKAELLYPRHAFNMNHLFKDATELRHLIEEGAFKLPENEKGMANHNLFNSMCQKIAYLRCQGEHKLDYDAIMTESKAGDKSMEEYKREAQEKIYDTLADKIKRLQRITATEGKLDPKKIGAFNRIIQLCQQRKQLHKALKSDCMTTDTAKPSTMDEAKHGL